MHAGLAAAVARGPVDFKRLKLSMFCPHQTQPCLGSGRLVVDFRAAGREVRRLQGEASQARVASGSIAPGPLAGRRIPTQVQQRAGMGSIEGRGPSSQPSTHARLQAQHTSPLRCAALRYAALRCTMLCMLCAVPATDLAGFSNCCRMYESGVAAAISSAFAIAAFMPAGTACGRTVWGAAHTGARQCRQAAGRQHGSRAEPKAQGATQALLPASR